jgi:hypothetical protein
MLFETVIECNETMAVFSRPIAGMPERLQMEHRFDAPLPFPLVVLRLDRGRVCTPANTPGISCTRLRYVRPGNLSGIEFRSRERQHMAAFTPRPR